MSSSVVFIHLTDAFTPYSKLRNVYEGGQRHGRRKTEETFLLRQEKMNHGYDINTRQENMLPPCQRQGNTLETTIDKCSNYKSKVPTLSESEQ